MWRANILAGFVLILWSFLLLGDIGLMKNMAQYQHQFGYPNAADIAQYIVIPAVILVIFLSAIFIFNFVARSPAILMVFSIIFMVPLLWYILSMIAAAAI